MKKNHFNLSETIISVIIITQNDSDIIEDRLKNIISQMKSLQCNYELLFVDNYSTDDTIDKIRNYGKKNPYIRIVVLSKPYDTPIALTAGLDTCIGDYVVLLNIYTDPPRVIRMLIRMLHLGYDSIIGYPKTETGKRNMINKLLLQTVSRFTSHKFVYKENYLMALNRKAVNSIVRTRRKSRNFSYINYLIGLKTRVYYYTPLKRFSYKLKPESFVQTIISVADIIISNSFRPIRFLTAIGILISLLFLLYVFAIILAYLIFDIRLAPQGWISVATVIGMMFFLLCSLLTLLSEYIIRIMNETRNEPIYFIADEIDKSIILPHKDRVNVV